MSADGLAQLRRMAEQARDLADNPAPLAALARLEGCAEESRIAKAAEAQRDTLAEALRDILYTDGGDEKTLARGALAEAGL